MARLSRFLLIIAAGIFFLAVSSKHPLHVSTTEISLNPKSKSLEITCRIFTDDFENILAKKYRTKADLSKESVHKAMDGLIRSYMDANLQYRLNDKLVTANYVGFEKDGEATNVYLEIENITTIQKLTVTNSILYDMFDDQMSILHVQRNGLRKSARTNYPDRTMQVTF